MSTVTIPPPKSLESPISVPLKTLMGPGPSNAADRVLQATALPVIGHLHPEFLTVMDDVKAGVQYAFQTANPVTLALSATGHAAMDCVMNNMVERGDIVLIAENGIWGERAGDMASRHGGDVRKVTNPASVPFSLADIESALKANKPKMFFITHGESSTGVLQDLGGIGELCRRHECILAVDSVAALGGVPLNMDALLIDILYTGSQKVLGVPPGSAPISFGERAMARFRARKTPPASFYLDLEWLHTYWGCNPEKPARVYHHTGPVNTMYGLREGLALLSEEGLEKCWQRHKECAEKLHKGLDALGLELFVAEKSARLPTVTTVRVPDGLDWKAVVKYAMQTYKVEISGGLGPTANKVFRIGLMGQNATPEKVDLVLKVLEEGLESVGYKAKL